MVVKDPNLPHPTEIELADYLGEDLDEDSVRRVELHLAQCPTCRREVMDARAILRGVQPVRWRAWAPVAAAAAVILLLVPWQLSNRSTTSDPVRRDAPVPSATSPVPVSPTGLTGQVNMFVWTRVAGADRYRVTVFDTAGSVRWRTITEDSAATLPDSVDLPVGSPFLWQVEARMGWDLWEASPLTEFRREGPGGPPPRTGDYR